MLTIYLKLIYSKLFFSIALIMLIKSEAKQLQDSTRIYQGDNIVY